MTERPRQSQLIRAVVHPTDLSDNGTAAFHHALAIAIAAGPGTSFSVLNAGESTHSEWGRFPPVRGTLEQWQRLPPDSDKSAVYETLGLSVSKIALAHGQPMERMLDYLDDNPADLIVLGTEARSGLSRWLEPSFASELGRNAGTASLFLPAGAAGFAGNGDGSLQVRRVLVAVDHDPPPQRAVDLGLEFLRMSRAETAEIILFHAGPEEDFPALDRPDLPGISWQQRTTRGEPVATICQAARELGVNLIAMTTSGRHGILDALRGSVTERVVRDAACPVLAVPA